MLTLTLILTLLRPIEACWTFDGRPTCSAHFDAWTCCDGAACFTFESEPDCEPAGEAFVCCG